MINEDIIYDFGIPEQLEKLDILFCFDDTLTEESFVGSGCCSKPDEAKFFLYDRINNQAVFTMHFYISEYFRGRLFKKPDITKPHVRLQHISTACLFRKKGIPSYYMQKLIEFCINNCIDTIALNIAPSYRNKKIL